VDRFRAVLTSRVAELERFTAHREGIAIERAPINWKRSRRPQNAPTRFVTSTVTLTNFGTLVQPSVVSKKATLGPARRAMKTSTPSGLPRCRGLYFAYGARKPWTAILKTFNRQAATCSVEPLEGSRGYRRGS